MYTVGIVSFTGSLEQRELDRIVAGLQGVESEEIGVTLGAFTSRLLLYEEEVVGFSDMSRRNEGVTT
jgi:hypothetical protein